MSVFQAIILGVVQGLTEFLPVSSSGHLIVIPNLFGWGVSPLVFDIMLHLGTAAALIIFFFKDLWGIFIGFVQDVWFKSDDFEDYSENGKMGLYIIIGSIPAAVLGYFFQDKIENYFRQVWFVALFLILGSVLMFTAEKARRWASNSSVDYKKSFIVGIFQSLALLPGVSRSGATISGGMLCSLKRDKAARFSFLLSIPIVVAAGLYKFYESKALFLDPNVEMYTAPIVLVAGFLSSFIVGMLAIKVLLDFLKKYGLNVFVVYRVILAALILFITFAG